MVATMQPNPWALLLMQMLNPQQQQPVQAPASAAQPTAGQFRMPGPISGTQNPPAQQPNPAQQATAYYNDPTTAGVMGLANMLATLGQITSQPGSTGAVVGQQAQGRYADFLYNRALANALSMYSPGAGGGAGGNLADFT